MLCFVKVSLLCVVVCYLLHRVLGSSLLSAVCWFSLAPWLLLFAVRCVLCVDCRSMFAVCWWLCWWLLRVVCCCVLCVAYLLLHVVR